MTYAIVGTGAVTSGFNATLTPAFPTYSTGNLLLLVTGEQIGSDPTPNLSAQGWTQLSPGTHAHQVALYGRIATGLDSVSIAWGNVYSFAWICSYSGNPSTLTGIVHASGDVSNSNSNGIVFPAVTITATGCLVIAAGARDKTATTNGATWNAISGYTKRQSSVPSGSIFAAIMNDQVQTSPVSFASVNQSLSISDSNQPYEGYVVALYPFVAVSGAPSSLTLTGVGL